jgi:hypothetical protein
MRDSRSLSLSRFPQCPFFQKLSRATFFFFKKISFFPHSDLFSGLSLLSRTREHRARKKRTQREKMDGARVLPLFFSLSVCISFVCERFLSSFFFEYLFLFFSLTTTKSLFHMRLSQNDRRRGVPRQPARRFRRRRF